MNISAGKRDDSLANSTEAVRVAAVMGLPRPSEMNDFALVEHIEAGLPVRAIDGIVKRLNPQDKTLKYRIISKASFSRLRKHHRRQLSKELSEKVYGIARVVAEALLLWDGDRQAASRFLHRPHPLLDGRKPFDVSRESAAGAELVVKIIGQARAGVAV